MAKTSFQFRFSVIIPLEFHRGQVEQCLSLWAHEQRYPRDQYEIVAVGCRTSLDDDTISFYESLLGDGNRLLLHDEPHDMALVAYGAKHAKGQILFFTESHCLPEADILAILEETFAARLDYAGFSCHSLRVTHNILSVIEADMYEKDIQYGMSHPWRRILDQCFAVRVEDYHAAGGFDPQFGHFAEWVLSARMHQQNKMIGYLPDANIHHYYSGEVHELIEFTLDFVRGELLYHANGYGDATRSYFTEPDEWRSRYNWLTQYSASMLRVLWLDYLNLVKDFLKTPGVNQFVKILKYIYRQNIPIRYRVVLNWFAQKYFGSSVKMWISSVRLKLLVLLIQGLIILQLNKNLLVRLFLQIIDALIQYEGIHFVNEWVKNQKIVEIPPQNSLLWKPDVSQNYPTVGLYTPETWEGQAFQWSQPVGLVETKLDPGQYGFTIDWLPIKPICNLRIYVNEKAVSFQVNNYSAKGDFELDADSLVRFVWTCEALKPPKDKRILGLPLKQISILPL